MPDCLLWKVRMKPIRLGVRRVVPGKPKHGVVELNRCQGTVFVNPFGQFIETGDELLLVDTQLFRSVRR